MTEFLLEGMTPNLLGILVLGALATGWVCLKQRSLSGCDVVLKYPF